MNTDHGVRLSPQIQKRVLIRISKISGQLKTVSKLLEESSRSIAALTQFSSANAAVFSLMRFVAASAADVAFLSDAQQEREKEAYLNQLLDVLLDCNETEYSLTNALQDTCRARRENTTGEYGEREMT